MKEHFDKIGIYSKNQLRKVRRLSRLEKLITLKSKKNTQFGFIKLRKNVIKSKMAELK